MSSCSPHSISHFIRTRKNGLQSFPPSVLQGKILPNLCNVVQLHTGRPAPWLEVEHLWKQQKSSVLFFFFLQISLNVWLHFTGEICKSADQFLEGCSA